MLLSVLKSVGGKFVLIPLKNKRLKRKLLSYIVMLNDVYIKLPTYFNELNASIDNFISANFSRIKSSALSATSNVTIY